MPNFVEQYANQAGESTPCDMPMDAMPISCAFFGREITVAAQLAANGEAEIGRAALAAFRAAGRGVDVRYNGGFTGTESPGLTVTHGSHPVSVHDLLNARVAMQ
jgi:hypothetical protein